MSVDPRDRCLAADAYVWTIQIVVAKERVEHLGPFLVAEKRVSGGPLVCEDLGEGFRLAVGPGV